MTSKTLPKGFHTVTPYLVVKDASEFLDFLSKAFQAQVTLRHNNEDGTVHHAQVQIGNSLIMLSDTRPEHPPMPGMIFLYVDSADEVYVSALAAGATSLRAPQDESHGDRMGGVIDKFGIQWWIATPIAPAAPEST